MINIFNAHNERITKEMNNRSEADASYLSPLTCYMKKITALIKKVFLENN